ncbi:hypothetical protein IE53DRAFT_383957 [Violaceomyces palustris]|uniref:Uncharacterized protein n=1 Tax=Violaceomyces palustris TaxID=1673888 RepID=A0ACD0P622_9BASI|nr:hypothetical protein IE53DRAFT_383957 [Violaceomyces palustris]
MSSSEPAPFQAGSCQPEASSEDHLDPSIPPPYQDRRPSSPCSLFSVEESETDQDHAKLPATTTTSEGFENGQPSFPYRGTRVAKRSPPPGSPRGIYLFPSLLSGEKCSEWIERISECNYFDAEEGRNQVMLFGREVEGKPSEGGSLGMTGLPDWSKGLVQELERVLRPELDDLHRSLLFPSLDQDPSGQGGRDGSKGGPPQICRSRQMILNLYSPDQGITSHVDLVNRFGDGIILCSFGPQGRGIAMDFEPVSKKEEEKGFSLFLPSRSVLLLFDEARYDWKHGIQPRDFDLVEAEEGSSGKVERLQRGLRLSVTIRWLLPGADVVGGEPVDHHRVEQRPSGSP